MKREILIAFIILTHGLIGAQAQTSYAGKTIEVKIYLLDTAGGFDTQNPELLAVARMVDAGSPLRSALEAQVEGATEEETSQSLHTPFVNIQLDSAKMENKTARLFFSQIEKEPMRKAAALLFRKAVTKTALQFPSVKKVEICLDGVEAFWRVDSKTTPRSCG